MAKKADDSVLDGLLDVVATSIEMYLCVGEPANRAAAASSSVIDPETMAPGDFTKGDYAGGREQETAAKSSIPSTSSGTPDHVALCTGSLLLYVTTVANPQAITAPNPVNIGPWKIQVADPA